MECIRINNNVSEHELDMKRRHAQVPERKARTGGRVRRLLNSMLGHSERIYALGTPRRSVDREQQTDSPWYESF